MTTVGLILIGNELLSGKIRDENGHHLASVCFNRGAALKFILTIPDILDEIATAISKYRSEVDILITSGGVGPTHDDITYAGVASAFNVDLVRVNELEEQILQYFGTRTTPAHLKMADLPSGATLMRSQVGWPTIHVENVFLFPGVPSIFRSKLRTIEHLLKGTRLRLVEMCLIGDEGSIAHHLVNCESQFHVNIGSYPNFLNDQSNITLTIESESHARLTQAIAYLEAVLVDGIDIRSVNWK